LRAARKGFDRARVATGGCRGVENFVISLFALRGAKSFLLAVEVDGAGAARIAQERNAPGDLAHAGIGGVFLVMDELIALFVAEVKEGVAIIAFGFLRETDRLQVAKTVSLRQRCLA